MSELKPCPFCGGKAEIERFGTSRFSTIYKCGFCSCTLETGETFNHGDQWSERHNEWVSVDENNNYPDPEKHKFILGIDMNDSDPYVFECEWDGDTWSNIGGESFTHWKPSLRP